MNDFGVPMSDAEMNMQPIKPHEKLMAESGLENNFIGAIVGGAISVAGSIIGGNKAAKSAKKQAKAQNAATERQYQYDLKKHEMNREQLIAEREEAIAAIEAKARNEQKIATFTDARNLKQYNRDLQIRDLEQASLNEQYLKSRDIYSTQTSLNDISEKQATENELRKYQEIKAESAFNIQDKRLERLRAEGQLRARGVTGRSARKAQQITGAEFGRMVAQVNESVASAGRNSKAILEEISADRISADLSAMAARMLAPGELPDPIKPMATPLAEFVYPRELIEADFGPDPVKGATYSASAAAGRVWGQTISSVAGSVGGVMMNKSAWKKGQF